MASKSAKRRKARKRERRADGAVILPSGKATKSKTAAGAARAMQAEAADAVALLARCRVYGLTEAQAADPLAGTATGRLVLAGLLTPRQDDAATRWRALRARYHHAIEIAPDGREGPGGTPSLDDRDEADAKAVARFREARAALAAAGHAAVLAVRIVVEDGHDAPSMLPDLRSGLMVLANHFGLPDDH